MTPERIAELRALASVAAPGPWEIHPSKGGDPDVVCVVEKFGLSVGATEPDSEWGVFHRKDAAFIAAARTALPEALDAIEDAADVIKNAERLLREGVKYSAALRRALAFCKEQVDRGDLPPGQREVWNNALAHVLAIASEGL